MLSTVIGFRYIVIELLITNQVLFLLFVIFSNSGRVCFVSRHLLSLLSVLSSRFHCFFRVFSVQSTMTLVVFYFHLHNMNMSSLNLNEFFSDFFSFPRNGKSVNHQWPGMGALGSPWPSEGHLGMSWPSVNCTAVSVRARSGPDSKPYRFHHNCEEMLLWKLRNFLSGNFLINHEFSILHDVKT